MIIALDIDGTLDERPAFFAGLARSFRSLGHKVIVLTYRDPSMADRTKRQLAGWGIEYDDLVFLESLEAKGPACARLAVDVFIDDQDECIVGVTEFTLCLKVRNGGNQAIASPSDRLFFHQVVASGSSCSAGSVIRTR